MSDVKMFILSVFNHPQAGGNISACCQNVCSCTVITVLFLSLQICDMEWASCHV